MWVDPLDLAMMDFGDTKKMKCPLLCLGIGSMPPSSGPRARYLRSVRGNSDSSVGGCAYLVPRRAG